MTEFGLYENQKGKRNTNKPVSKEFARYDANCPVLGGEVVMGDLDTTFKMTLDQYQDGWKYICGVVYSLESHGNMAFEKDSLNKGEVHPTILFLAPHCEVRVFD
jgi:hypothetical protein